MATKQQLGIELSLSLDTKFSELIKQIEKQFGNIDLKGFEAKVAGVEGKISGLAKEIAKVVNGNANKIQISMDTSKLRGDMDAAIQKSAAMGAAIRDVNGKVVTSLQGMMSHGAQITAIISNTNKAYSELGTQILAANKNTEAANKASIKSFIERGTSILAAEKNTTSAVLAERAKQAQQGSSLLSGLKNSGMQSYNGSVVPSTYVTDIAQAHVAAIKYNETLKTNNAQLKHGEEILASLGRQGKAHWNGQEVSVQQYSKNLKEMNGEFKEAAKSSNEFSTKLGQMAKTMAEFYLIRGAFFAISNQITSAAKELIGFNQALYDTAAVANASSKSIAIFGDTAMQIAKSSKMDLKEVMKLMNLLAQSGVSEKDVPMVSRVAAMFATGTGSSPENAVRVLTTSLNVWAIEAGRAGMVTDTLTAGLNAAKIEVNELSTVFNYLAPVAKLAGYSLQETMGIVATMSQMGVKSSTIGTGVTSVLTRLMSPTKGIKDLAKEYDIAIEELNPRLHKFSEIVNTLQHADGGKAIPVNDLMRGFGQIAGKSISAAVVAGSEYFKEMERNVSNSNSTLIANAKALEGVGAKLNILRQTFVEALSGMSAFKIVGGGIYEVLLALARGLDTSNGRMAVAITVIGSLAAAVYVFHEAILRFVTTNPLGVWITVISLALGGLLTIMGAMATETLRANREHDALAKKAGDTQRAFQEVSAIYGEAAKNGKQHSDMTNEHKARIAQLVLEYPHLRDQLKLTTGRYDDLTDSMKKMNAEMAKTQATNAGIYNAASKRIEGARNKSMSMFGFGASYNEAMGNEDQRVAQDKLYYSEEEALQRSNDRKAKINAKFREFVKDDVALLTKVGGETPSYQPTGERNVETASYGQLALNPYVQPKDDTAKTGKLTNGKEPMDMSKPVDQVKLLDKLHNSVNKNLEAYAVKDTESWIDQLKTEMKNDQGNKDNDPVSFKMAADELTEQYKNVEGTKRKKVITDFWSNAATDLNASYDSKKNILTFSGDHKQDNKDTYEKLKSKYAAELNRDLSGFDKANASEAAKNVAKEGVYEAPAAVADKLSKDNTMRDEKMEGMRLAKIQAELAVRKSIAKTADEVRLLDLEGLDNQLMSASMLEKSYTTRLNDVYAEEELFKSAEDYNNALEMAKDNLDAIHTKIKGIKVQQDEMADAGFFSNLTKGRNKALIAQGDTKSNTEQLGQDMTNTVLTGMNNLLDQSITKLAKLEWSWKSFRDTLGNVMKGIAEELQKYYIKLMVVYAAEKLVGLFAGGAASGGPGYAANSPSGVSQPAFSVPDFVNGTGYAGGGTVVGGVAGKDSVVLRAMPGEIVIKKSSVDAIGASRLLYANEYGKLPGFANGGLVGGGSAVSGEGQSFSLQIVNVASVESIPQAPVDAQQVINIVSFDAARKGTTYKTFKGIIQNG